MSETETSHALPAYYYDNPAKVVENNELIDLGCRACKYHTTMLERVVCGNEKVPFAVIKKVPRIGRKCKQFELNG